MRAQIVGVAGLRTRRRMAVVAVERDEPAFAQQRAAFRFDLDAKTRQRVVVGQHVRLARQRRGASRRTQVIAERVLRRRQRNAVPRCAVRIHVASGIERHARRPANAGLHVRVIESHAARGQRIEMRCVNASAVAGQMVATELVAHDEEHVADDVHRDRSRRFEGGSLQDGSGATSNPGPAFRVFRDNDGFAVTGQRDERFVRDLLRRGGGTGRRSGLKIRR